MKPFVFALLLAAGLTGCASAERQAAADRDRCAAQGLAPDSSAYVDCLAAASAAHADAETRQSDRMRQMQEHGMDDFLNSNRLSP
jgi:hypothetical protein